MAIVTERRTIRADGPEKVTGSGRYAADLTLTGMLHAKFRYAGVAHGRITRLDTTRARALPGVLAVITQADVPDVRYGPYVKDRTLFARDVVRYEGEIVAAVAALTPEIAQAAVDAIELEIEPLPVVDDLEAALADDAPLVHADWAVLRCRATTSSARATSPRSRRSSKGDVEAGMRDGRRDRHAPATSPTRRTPCRSSRARSSRSGRATSSPSGPRRRCRSTRASGVAETLQLPESRVRIIVPHLGGGFGGKCGFHHEAHVAALARKARRPGAAASSRGARSSSSPTAGARAW